MDTVQARLHRYGFGIVMAPSAMSSSYVHHQHPVLLAGLPPSSSTPRLLGGVASIIINTPSSGRGCLHHQHRFLGGVAFHHQQHTPCLACLLPPIINSTRPVWRVFCLPSSTAHALSGVSLASPHQQHTPFLALSWHPVP